MNTLQRAQAKLKLIVDGEFNEEQKKIIEQYKKDDAGSDLESFFGDDVLGIDEEIIWEVQYLIEDINELEYLYKRSEQLDNLQASIETLKGFIKNIFNV